MARALNEKLKDAGYQMFGQEDEIEDLILSILKTKDIRYLKAIPFLMFIYSPDFLKILAKTKNKALFKEIIGITRKIFQEEKIQKVLPNISKRTQLDYLEFKQEFEVQKRRTERPNLLSEKEKIYAERNLQMWLSYIFTKKEREIIDKVLNEENITKTEYEYYSRKTKKKLNAIMNLQDFSRALSPLSPLMRKE